MIELKAGKFYGIRAEGKRNAYSAVARNTPEDIKEILEACERICGPEDRKKLESRIYELGAVNTCRKCGNDKYAIHEVCPHCGAKV